MSIQLIPAVYDGQEESWLAARQMLPWGAVILHGEGRRFTQAARDANPDVLVIHRHDLDRQMPDLLTGPMHPYTNGINIAEQLLGADGSADAYIGLNEPPCRDWDQAHNLAQFDAGFADRMGQAGKIALIGGFASGGPEPDIFQSYLSYFAQARVWEGQNNVVLHCHAYGPNLLPGHGYEHTSSDLMDADPPNNALRFRDRWLPEVGGRFPYPVIISEIGPSGFYAGMEGEGGPGWKGRWGEGDVWEDRREWLRQADLVAGVLGAAPYCLGDSGRGADPAKGEQSWERFNEVGTQLPWEAGQWNAQIMPNADVIRYQPIAERIRQYGQQKEAVVNSEPVMIQPGLGGGGDPAAKPAPGYVGAISFVPVESTGQGLLETAERMGYDLTGEQICGEIYLKDGQGRDTYSYAIWERCRIEYHPYLPEGQRVHIVPFLVLPPQ